MAGGVDSAFIQDVEHRPKVNDGDVIEAEGIPVIDLSVFTEGHEALAFQGLVDDVGKACKDWGFFQAVNHGVQLEKLRKVEEAAKKFFEQPVEEKRKIRRDEANPLGFSDGEHTKDVRDWKEVFDATAQDPTLVPASVMPDDDEVGHWTNKWPDNIPELREAWEEYIKEMEKFGLQLMELIARSLGLSPKRFYGFFEEHNINYFRVNYYPTCPSPHLALGAGGHKDSGVLTILAALDDVEGLEVKRKSDGNWVRVKPITDAYIINIGDIIQVWSNGAYESIEHRVIVNSKQERYSIAFFFNPAYDTVVEPLMELVTEENPAKYRPYDWGKFMVTRKRGNFTKLGFDYVQVGDFRVNI